MSTEKYVIAVDCDGTCDVSQGPVPLRGVMSLAIDHDVWVIGNRALCTVSGLPCVGIIQGLFVSGLDYPGGKSQALKDLKARLPGRARYIVVDDLPGQYMDGWDGWEFMSPPEFIEKVLRA